MSMKNNLIVLLLCIGWHVLAAQYEPVLYAYELNYFNNGQPLPAESHIMIHGDADTSIKRVEISLFKGKSSHDHNPMHQASWKRLDDSKAGTFRIPFNYQLHSNEDYDFVITYFREINDEERIALKALLENVIGTYLEQQISLNNGKAQLGKSPAALLSGLNEIVEKAMTHYRHVNEISFRGFSEVILEGLKVMNHFQEPAKSAVDGTATSPSLAEKRQQLHQQALLELSYILDTRLLVQTDLRSIREYPTEKARNTLAINLGYGGVYLAGNTSNFSYGSGPYIGLSFPLSSRYLGHTFWSNTSISAGAFLQDFVNEEDQVISGPIFGRPYYVALGYNLFRFVRLNAGMTVLEAKGSSSIGGGSIEVGDIKVKPFVGISAEIQLSLGFKEKR